MVTRYTLLKAHTNLHFTGYSTSFIVLLKRSGWLLVLEKRYPFFTVWITGDEEEGQVINNDVDENEQPAEVEEEEEELEEIETASDEGRVVSP